jgi:LysM repeat protein
MKRKYAWIAFAAFLGLSLMIAPAAFSQTESMYTVKKGDTLWEISQKLYGDPHLWPALWALNQGRTTNPHVLSVGDELVIHPKAVVEKKMVEMKEAKAATPEPAPAPKPSPPPAKPESLYEPSQPIETLFPKYFTFVAEPESLKGAGYSRVQVKKVVYETKLEVGEKGVVSTVNRRTLLDTNSEAYEVGDIVASEERGTSKITGQDIHGRVLLAAYDKVIVNFKKDVAKILESAAHGESDPYFRDYPIYALGDEVQDPTDAKGKNKLGSIFHFRGMLKVVARLDMSKARQTTASDRQAVLYVAQITNSVEPIQIGDKLFVFKRVK